MGTVATGHSVLHIDITLLSQNQAGNYSTVHIQMYSIADAGWAGSSSTAIGYSVTIPNGAGQVSSRTWGYGSRVDWADYTTNVTHLSNGVYSDAVRGHINDTGTTTYGGPADVSQSFAPPRIPKVPGAPTVAAAAPVGNSIAITVTAPADNGGSSIDSYTTQYSKDGGAWTGDHTGATFTYTALAPGSYIFRTRAHNAIGYGAFSASTAARVVTAAGKRCTVGGATPTFVPFSILRRYDLTGAVQSFKDITIAKRYTAAGWIDFTG